MATDIYLNTLTYLKTEIDDKMTHNLAVMTAALAAKADLSDIGSPSGIATLDATGVIPDVQLPTGYTGDVTMDGTTLTIVNGIITAVVQEIVWL